MFSHCDLAGVLVQYGTMPTFHACHKRAMFFRPVKALMLPSRDPAVCRTLVTSFTWLDPAAEDDRYLLRGNIKTCLQSNVAR